MLVAEEPIMNQTGMAKSFWHRYLKGENLGHFPSGDLDFF